MTTPAHEWRRYWQVVLRRLPVVLLVSAFFALLVYGVLVRRGPTYTVHYSYMIALAEREESDEFEFDGYYALQATDLFATTLAAWAKAPEVVVAAYDRAAITERSSDARILVRSVEADKRAPQLVHVAVTHEKRETAEALAKGLDAVLVDYVTRYHDEGIPALRFNIVATPAWTSSQSLAIGLIVTVVFVLSCILGINAVLLRESFVVDSADE